MRPVQRQPQKGVIPTERERERTREGGGQGERERERERERELGTEGRRDGGMDGGREALGSPRL